SRVAWWRTAVVGRGPHGVHGRRVASIRGGRIDRRRRGRLPAPIGHGSEGAFAHRGLALGTCQAEQHADEGHPAQPSYGSLTPSLTRVPHLALDVQSACHAYPLDKQRAAPPRTG